MKQTQPSVAAETGHEKWGHVLGSFPGSLGSTWEQVAC